MLPDKKISLTKKAEDKLKRIKQTTGENVNQLANERFFTSLEKGVILSNREKERPAMGDIKLEKSAWLGDCQSVVEAALKRLYPNVTKDEAAILWALHIESTS
ncbi:DndE family protein [Bisbaumannia pacifica]|uniref:DndE family protein n=1 Tax=Bisbaumannia pacifica TaxID=77098 RepID=A0ABD4L2Z8_9GAMM|nr:DndE family protein [Halomonas pacifica]MBH8581095.1 DndE family protein [Halomonas pacifica]